MMPLFLLHNINQLLALVTSWYYLLAVIYDTSLHDDEIAK